MASSEELLHQGIDQLQTEELTYADDWTDESISWARNGVYKEVARHVPALRSGALHMDLGSGVGIFPMYLARKNAAAVVLGIDRNPHMLRHTRSLHAELQELEGVPIPLEIHHSEIMALMPDGSVKSFYVPTEELKKGKGGTKWIPSDALEFMQVAMNELNDARLYPTPNPDLNRPGAKLIIDDLTRLELTRHFLGDRQLQSVSSMFPGSSARILREAGVTHGDYARAQAVFAERSEEKNKKEMEFIVERLAPGGTFMMVSRVPAHLTENERGRKQVGQSFEAHLDGYTDQFEPSFDTAYIKGKFRNPTDGRIAWIAPGGKSQLQEARVAIVRFKKK